MDITVISVNYKTKKLLKHCIESIKEQTSGVNYEVLVVDNASNDGSVEMVQTNYPDVKVLDCKENIGYGRGNNAGMKLATSSYYFFLNPDTVLMNNALKILFDFMERAENRSIAVCGAALFDGTHEPAVSFGKFPTVCSMIFYSLPFSALLRSKKEGIVPSPQTAPFTVDFISGADLFVRREVLERIGGFDEKYFAYYEEVDLAHRIAQLGYLSVIVPSAGIMHLEGRSFKHASRRKKLMYESSLHYLSKYKKKNSLFKLYCLVNEFKYRIYRLLLPASSSSFWSEMISTTKYYRTKI